MVVFYLDTSALVKRNITEDGTEFVNALFEGAIKKIEHPLSSSTLLIGAVKKWG